MKFIIALFCVALATMVAIPVISGLQFFGTVPAGSWLSMGWAPDAGEYGLGLPLAGSLLVVLVSLPPTIILAWGLAFQVAGLRGQGVQTAAISLMQTWAAMPSVVIGVWAISAVLPLIREVAGSGYSLLAASAGLTLFLAPAAALLFMQSYKEYRQQYGDLEKAAELTGMERSIIFFKGCSGEVGHVIKYTFCRLFGETMIVLMLSGNALQLPGSLFDGVRTMTATIALEAAYATGEHELALHGLAMVSILILGITMLLRLQNEKA